MTAQTPTDHIPTNSPVHPSPARPTLGAELERRRLEHRARRLGFVVAALRVRAEAQPCKQAGSTVVVDALGRCTAELARVRGRLATEA